MWVLYELVLCLGVLLYIPKAIWRRRLPHQGWLMRLGGYPASIRASLTTARDPSAVWIHAVSVGEVVAVQPLIRELVDRVPHVSLVLSTTTPSGYDVASRFLGRHGVAIYNPLDFRVAVTRSLRLIRPRLLLLVESELWPNLIHVATHAHVPIVVVNGRISMRAFRRYRWVKRWVRPMLESIQLFLVQTDTDAARLIELGAPASRVTVLGSLKWDASLESRPSQDELDASAKRLGLGSEEDLLVAGSTHRGEEAAVLAAFHALRSRFPRLKLLIAPRHLERVGEVEALVRRRGLTVRRLSEQMDAPQPWEVTIVDRLGQLPVYYGLATVVFVGGSLIPHGGQNPLEPASLGKPAVFGPWMHNFADIVQQLLAHNAAVQLTRAEALAQALQTLLSDRAGAHAMGWRAQELTERSRGVAQRTAAFLDPFLPA